MEEIWKDIQGFEGLYQVSSLGAIKILGKPPLNGMANWRIKILKKEKIKKQGETIWGYKQAHLYKNGVGKALQVHRLVAMAFIENPDNLPIINHRNGIKTDNRVENLEWCTYSENLKHAFKIGLKKPSGNLFVKGHKRAKVRPIIQKSLDGEFIKNFPSILEAHKLFGKKTNIPACLSGRQTQSCGYKWEYA